MASEDLLGFVKDALGQGVSKTDIGAALLTAGWDRERVSGALGTFADVDFPVPVPRPQPYVSARETFLTLVLFSALYTTAINLGSIAFQFINLAFPDPAAGSQIAEFARIAIRWSVSSLVVAGPIFLFVSAVAARERRRDPAKRGSTVRRWLTYLTLFAAASVLSCDVIALVYDLLGGELTIRFLLKAATVGIIAGTIFSHYLRDVRRDEQGDAS
jgi:Domain of unknown function (DUF5671)